METLAALLDQTGLDRRLAFGARLTGEDPVLPSSFRIGEAAQSTIAAVALAVGAIHAARGGPMQGVSVEMRHAALEFRSERHLRENGAAPPDPWDAIAGAYSTRDGRVVRLHTNFPHHRDGILRLLGCEASREAVAEALRGQDAIPFEEEATAAGLCVAAMRDFAEWDAHGQGKALAAVPLIEITRIGDAPPLPLPPLAARPLEGMRVLELTRVIAGPVAGRALAAHGAQVLQVSAPHLPAVDTLVKDTGRGKRCAALDLREASARDRLRGLVQGADAFLQSYRPGGLSWLGFSAPALAALRPGIVVAELSAYGWTGPWGGKRGFDSLVQTASGFNVAEAEAAGAAPPRVLPCQPLDHASGYLLALGILSAWMRRAQEGGSWHVRVALARTGMWLRGLGRVADGFRIPEPRQEEIGELLTVEQGAWGVMTHLRHAARMDATPPHWALPAAPLGSSPADWA